MPQPQALPSAENTSEDTLELPVAGAMEAAAEGVLNGTERFGEVRIRGRRLLIVEIPDEDFVDEVLDVLDARELRNRGDDGPAIPWEQVKAELQIPQ